MVEPSLSMLARGEFLRRFVGHQASFLVSSTSGCLGLVGLLSSFAIVVWAACLGSVRFCGHRSRRRSHEV